MVAALYVARGGCYFGLPDVDPYDISRDARLYAGPWPVVAHPPCERWGKYWFGSTSPHAPQRFAKGDDGGCFAAALEAVRRYGGVLEHPAKSHAWRAFGLIEPSARGGWVIAERTGITMPPHLRGWTCRIDQSAFGHRAQKPTWLYAVGCDLPSLPWKHVRVPDPAGRKRRGVLALLSHTEREATPPAFRDLLLSMARSVPQRRCA